MSDYFANDPECHDLLPWALRSHRVAGLGEMSHRAACGCIHVHVDSGPVRSCGPVPFAVTAANPVFFATNSTCLLSVMRCVFAQ